MAWILRRNQFDSYVRTAPGDQIQLVYRGRVSTTMSRKDARLIAKRINQCLDRTVKK